NVCKCGQELGTYDYLRKQAIEQNISVEDYLKTADELAYPEGTNDFDRASELLEIAEAGVPDEIKQQAQEFFNSQKYRDAIDKNKFGIYDKLYNRTLLQYGNTDPNYNPNYDLGDVFCVTKVEKGDEVGWTSYLTGFPESEIIANNQLNAAGKLAIGNTYIYECADNSYFEKYETYRDNGEDYYVIDNYQVPQGEKVNIDELLEARGVDREVFNLFNPAYAKSEEAYADQILTLPLEHPDFKPDTFVDAWGNEFQVEKPSYVKEKDRRTYEAMMAPIMASYGGNMPASILTEREYSNAVYNFNNPAEVQQLIADNPELFYDFREANLYILLYHGDNKTLYTPSMTYKEDLYGGAKYTYHANGADVTYDKSTLYSLIGIDSAQLSWSSPTEPPYSDTTFYRDEKDKSKRYSNTIYSNTTIEFDYKTLKDINRFD
ncbi:hypothetical protein IJ425_07825, partial [bacterium]|nr:hypothetical protein [bacterium]